MGNNYYIDLNSLSISAYMKKLQKVELLPSRMILKEEIEFRFSKISNIGIKNIEELLSELKTPVKLKSFASKTEISEEYLIILKREIMSNFPKPVEIKDFPGIPKNTVLTLSRINIKNTKQLFDFVKTETERKEFCKKTSIPPDEVLELTKLTDVSRIRWVGANFARLLVDSGCDTVKKIIKADYEILYNKLIKINEEKKYFKGKFGLNDMKVCIIAAKDVPDAIKL
jgi:hypothetical protein